MRGEIIYLSPHYPNSFRTLVVILAPDFFFFFFFSSSSFLSPHCHHQNVFSIMMGIAESHFNDSLTVRDKVTRQCLQTTTF